MQVFFSNLGCKLNQAEVERLSRQFLAAGHDLAPSLEAADLHVVNSCTVTHGAARDSRKTARRGARLNPRQKTVLTGCYANSDPREAARLAGVDLVVPNQEKERLLELVHAAFPETAPALDTDESGLPVPFVPLQFGHARAMVKVEDGCNMKCSFCIIPATRGRQRSRALEEVVSEVRALTAAGYPEVVITGVQISEYDHEGRRLYDLMRALLEGTEIPRLRVTSIAPWKFDHRLLELWQDPRLCRHIHMSLQSGSTATLRRMRRPYGADGFRSLADSLYEAIPGLALTTDVIVGFPGESDEEFDESLAFVEAMAFARPHIFTYSRRPGTHADSLPDQVPHPVKKERMARMLEAGRKGEHDFYERHLGQAVEVVWEQQQGDGRLSGLSDNYIRVYSPPGSDPGLVSTITAARLDRLDRQGVAATPLI